MTENQTIEPVKVEQSNTVNNLIIVVRCFDCDTTNSLNIDINKVLGNDADESKKLIEAMEFEKAHGLHRGFVLNQRIKDESDVVQIVKEISMWLK